MPPPALPTAGRLAARGIVRVAGADARHFLQGLVTADLRAPRRAATYAHFLDARGRVALDALLHERPCGGGFDVDVAGSAVGRLCRHLRMYALRAGVTIDDVSEEVHVWAACGGDGGGAGGGVGTEGLDEGFGAMAEDPRLPGLGLRGLVSPASGRSGDEGVGDVLDVVRMVLGVPEGADFEGGRLPLEMGLQGLGGVSFEKGCYLGQELTARTFHTGTVRKHVSPFLLVREGGDRVVESIRLKMSSGGFLEEMRQKARTDPAAALLYANAMRDVACQVDASSKQDIRNAEKGSFVGEEVFVQGKKRPVGSVTSLFGNLGLAVLRLEDCFPSVAGATPPVIGRPLRLSDGAMIVPWRAAYLNP